MPAADPGYQPDPAPFRVAVAGEFNSGKSSLIDLMLRRMALPVGVTWSGQPPIQLPLGDDVTLIEVPIDESGHLGPEAQAALGSADMLIWCTMAQRAWCLSESDLVAGLPARLLRNGVIAVTRSDLLDAAARDRVRDRVAGLTADIFARLVMVDASAAVLEKAGDDAVFEAAGGRGLIAAITAAAQAAPVLVLTGADATPPARWSDACSDIEAMIGAPLPEGALWQAVRDHLAAFEAEAPVFGRAQALLGELADDPGRDLWALDLALELNDRLLPAARSVGAAARATS